MNLNIVIDLRQPDNYAWLIGSLAWLAVPVGLWLGMVIEEWSWKRKMRKKNRGQP